MKKYVLIFWELAGCVLIVAALSTAINYRKMVKQDAPADIKMDEAGDVGTTLDTDDKESGIPQNQPEDDTAVDEPVYAQNDEGEDSGRYQGEIVLETEYEVRDYCKGYFIVSKNDGLLYGLMDIYGNEIIPIQYDMMDFHNKEHVINERSKNLYLCVRYENQYYIGDTSAKLLFDGYASVIDFESGQPDADSAYWNSDDSSNKIYRIYKEDTTLLQEIDYSEGSELHMVWLSPDYYIASISKGGSSCNIYIYDKNANAIMQWNDVELLDHKVNDDGSYYLYLYEGEGIYTKYSLSKNGDVDLLKSMDRDESKEERANDIGPQPPRNEWLLGKDHSIKLYRSNGTYKLVDQDGNALYDQRYYKCFQTWQSYILNNEDNQSCLINQNGKLVIDYGWLEADPEQWYISFLGYEIGIDCILDGGSEVAIVVRRDGISSIYMFSEIAD